VEEAIISPFPVFIKNEWYVPDIAKAVLHSKSCSQVPPEDWWDSTKYDPITQEIFASWIPVHDILLKKKDKALGTLFVNPPVLPCYVDKKPHVYCAFIMNVLTLQSTSIYKNGGHNAGNASQSLTPGAILIVRMLNRHGIVHTKDGTLDS
jgi:hypothetical protein